MGEVTENIHTFALPNESQPYTFKMKYRYDSWKICASRMKRKLVFCSEAQPNLRVANRVQTITYPDGEVVHYRYNTGGMLDTVYGKKTVSNMVSPKGGSGGTVGPIIPIDPSTTYTYNYINHTTYNEFELKSGQWYGNGTHSHYRYDILQRLDTLLLYNSIGQPLQNIKYTYDKVGNITRIQNLAGIYDSLGGRYNCRYIYDSLYRLTLATDSLYRGTMLVGRYGQYTDYFPDGRIQHKQDETWLLNSMFPFITNTYTYGNPDQPHTLTSISGWLRSSSTYTWDANGNMTKQGSIKLEWDEENRLKGVTKSAQGVCFAYDASGERFYKNSGPMTTLMVNGRRVRLPLYGAPVLYTSPYVVVTPNGYTKHYFVENERFASRIGDGNITGLNSHATTNAALAAKQLRVNKDAPDSIPPGQFYNFRTLPAHWSSHHTTYWQHPDHLGSASWVTDTNGRGYQHFQYRAWGEPFIEQNSTANGYETRYTFSGKERDEETGYSYFGARYYNSDLCIWLSVVPLADKYPGVSPYVYCANNPVRLVDPNGDTLKFAEGVSQEFKNKYAQAYTFMKEHGTSEILDKLDESTSIIYIDECNGTGSYSPNESTIYWDPNTAAYTDEGILLSPATILNHEADHALQSILNPQQQRLDKKTQDDQYDNAEERRVITGSEQATALKHGEIKEGQVTRKNHRSYPYYVDSPTSTGTAVIIVPQD